MQLLVSGWIAEWSTDASIDRQPLAPPCSCAVSHTVIMTKVHELQASERWEQQVEPECLGTLLIR